MRVRPGCRVGEVHLLDWSPQLLLLSHLLHNSSLDIYFCFVQTQIHDFWTATFTETLLKNTSMELFTLLSSPLLCSIPPSPSLPWEPEEELSLRQNWYCLVLRGIVRMVLRTWRGASETKLVLPGSAWYCAHGIENLKWGIWGKLGSEHLLKLGEATKCHPCLFCRPIESWSDLEIIISSLVPVSLYNWNCGSPGWGGL